VSKFLPDEINWLLRLCHSCQGVAGKDEKKVFLSFLRVQKYGARQQVCAVGHVYIQTQNFACW
jgi:hypothetical protein